MAEVTETLENQGSATGSAVETQEVPARTFTEEDVNNLMNKRFKEYKTLQEKAQKFDELQEASKSELEKAKEKAAKLQTQLDALTKENEVRAIKDAISKDTGVPSSLLSGATEEEMRAQATAILAFAKPSGYPSVKDGGEVVNISSGATRDQFADFFNNSIK